ncbi:hypothetical protein QVD17_02772 [Tagetes erecta]|uniref:Mediator of RNA polymerase II transcription subunit 19 n=1 Tax=Tagetes erecta TaxID=13708 RepID=A0AAD8LCA1_TARER|nr:hypothetical protein QVD17_02772 [Tagetes erecta]
MDLEHRKFGKGPKELTGAVDLIKYYNLYPHYEFFCKKSVPSSISDSHYLRNVVGDTEIRKGEGMQLNQLVDNKPFPRGTNIRMHPFDLNALRDAFYLRETAPIELPDSEKGIPTQVGRSKSELKHKKHKDKDREKHKEHKKHKHRHKDRNKDKENENALKTSLHDSGAEHLKKSHDKKRKIDGDDNLNGIHRHQNTKYKRSKMDEFGVIRIAA